MVYLTLAVTRAAARRPVTWGPEFASQFAFAVRVCFLPLALSAFVISFGPLGVQVGGFFGIFGSYDRMGSLLALIEIRELAPFVVGIILAGAAGTAMCADLGARVVREEISALRVLGVDPIMNLVLPRALALLAAGLLLHIVSLSSGLLGACLILVQNHQPLWPTIDNFLANASALELGAATVKVAIFALIVAVVSCYNGISVSGGPEGVGRAVNRSVVIAFLAMAFVNYVFTQTLLATQPELSQVRG